MARGSAGTDWLQGRHQSAEENHGRFGEGIESGDYDVVLLLSPKKQEKESLIEKTKLFYLPYPVYFDVNNEFLSRNEVIPGDAQYHTMYIGKDSRVKMVGDPTAGEKIKEVFDCVKGQ